MKIYFLNTISAGFDLFNFVSKNIKIDGYIGLTDKRNNSDVSGYFRPKGSDQINGVPYYEFETYNISSKADHKLFESLSIDVLIVGGWQRLIPEALIQHCNICAIGVHGSPLGINKGRGRSPQNWSLIFGLDTFEFSIFKIDKGVDSGDLISSSHFEYEPADNIRTSYIKATSIAASLISNSILSGKIFQAGTKQTELDAEYFPQRLKIDGQIDWERSGAEIYDFVRALTKPYPGAYSVIDGKELIIWSCVPFNEFNTSSGIKAGTILDFLSESELLIACGTGAIIVTDYSYEDDIKQIVGRELNSVNFGSQLKSIVERHNEKHKDLKISKLFL